MSFGFRLAVMFWVACLGILVASATAPASDDLGDEPSLWQVRAPDAASRTALVEMGMDVLDVNTRSGLVTVLVSAIEVAELQAAGFAATPIGAIPRDMPNGYDAYHDYDESTAEIEALHDLAPDITRVFSIGVTHEGRELWALVISDNPDLNEADEPAFVLVAQHHAREILTVEVALGAARRIVEGYGVDERLTALVDSREIIIIPTINPDGALFDQISPSFLLWRKNRRPSNAPSFCWGVDLNRNYSMGWGGPGASAVPCMLTWHGPSAFSEPETAALRDLITARDDVGTLITLHTYSELILWPWSHQSEPIDDPVASESFETLANTFAGFNGYTPQRGAELYLASGDTIDWAWGTLGIFAFTFELSPSSPLGGAFYPDASIIPPTIDANFEPIVLAAGLAAEPRRVLSTDLWKLRVEGTVETLQLVWAPWIETAPAGWNVDRRDPDGDRTRLNDEPIPPGQGAYAWDLDAPVEPGTYEYIVEYVSAVSPDRNIEFAVMYEVGDDDDDDTDDDDSEDDDASNDDLNDDTDGEAAEESENGEDAEGGCSC
ncbi:MAG: zinc carboxypeptidase [Deltaproteobacteria bacterium]|nr:zinc carboxypeptidase [Deltaproteobacteria bacterium]